MIDKKHNERIDHLFDTDLRIIQSQDVFSFSLDAVLLAKFVHVPIQRGKIIDLCTGNGIIPILLSERTKGQITGVEIQSRLYDMAVRSVQLNHLEERLTMLCDDVKQLSAKLGFGKFDVVTCNPPYFAERQAQKRNPNPFLAIARHEIYLTLEEAMNTSAQLVKHKGKVAFIHRPERLVDLLTLMQKNRLIPKRVQFVHPKAGKASNMVLVEAVKDGNPGLTVCAPIHVYDHDGHYTKELLTIAGR